MALFIEPIVIPLRPALLFAVVLARVGGLVTFAPFWSLGAASKRVRVLLALSTALALSFVVGPRLPTPPVNLISLAIVIMGELAVGCAIGLIGRLLFSAFETAAHMIGYQMGFALASVIDPATRAQTTALGTAANMIAMMFLLAIDGHHWFLVAASASYSKVAPGGFFATPQIAELMLRLSADALAMGIALAAPAIIVLLAVEFVIAAAGRAAPQLQLLLIGFPIKIAVGFWVIGASLYLMPGAFKHVLGTIRIALGRVLNLL